MNCEAYNIVQYSRLIISKTQMFYALVQLHTWSSGHSITHNLDRFAGLSRWTWRFEKYLIQTIFSSHIWNLPDSLDSYIFGIRPLGDLKIFLDPYPILSLPNKVISVLNFGYLWWVCLIQIAGIYGRVVCFTQGRAVTWSCFRISSIQQDVTRLWIGRT